MIAFCAVSIAVAAGLLVAGSITRGHASPPQAAGASSGNPLWTVSLRTLSETRDRPIFSPSRRPPEPPVMAQAPPPAPPPTAKTPEPDRPPLSMLGTVVGGHSIGIFIEDAGSKVLRLHTGQDYAGWVLRAVKRREAKFEKGNSVATLSLPAPREEQPIASTAGAPPGATQRINSASATVAQVPAPPAYLTERRRRD